MAIWDNFVRKQRLQFSSGALTLILEPNLNREIDGGVNCFQSLCLDSMGTRDGVSLRCGWGVASSVYEKGLFLDPSN